MIRQYKLWETRKYRPMAVAGRSAHTEENVSNTVDEPTLSHRPAIHQISREMGFFQSSLAVIVYTAILVWRDTVRKSWMKPTDIVFVTPDLWLPNSHDLSPINCSRVESAMSTRQKCRMWMSWSSVWLVCVRWSGTQCYWAIAWPVAQTYCLQAASSEPEEDILNVNITYRLLRRTNAIH